MSLTGKVVVITGGSRGLGLEIARVCGARGARLVLAARNHAELEAAAAELVGSGVRPEWIRVHACDVTEEAQVQELIACATGFWGRVDVLVNNAGIILVGPAETFNLSDYERTMQLNFFGALRTTLAVLPQMLGRQSGAIVNISSIGGKVPVPHLLPYVASKFALTGWSTGLRTELAPKGIRVLTVSPGVMATGSPVQALFKGNAAAEYAWFATSATLPLSAINAGSAAVSIVDALQQGKAELEVGLQAKLAARLVNLVPSATAAALTLANNLLPSAPSGAIGSDAPVPGSALESALPAPLARRNKTNMRLHNQKVAAQP